MAKVKRQSVSQVQEKASRARAWVGDKYGSERATEEAAMNLSRGKKTLMDKVTGRYPNAAEKKAAKLMQGQRAAETERSAARAAAVTKRAVAKAEQAKKTRAFTGGAKKAAPKAKKK